MNLYMLLDIPANMFPDHEILVDGEHRESYDALKTRVGQLASALQAAGVGPNDRVAFIESNRKETLEVMFATALAGATFVPINHRAKTEEIQYMLDRVEIKAAFVGTRYLPMVLSVREQVPSLHTVVTFEQDQKTAGVEVYEEFIQQGEVPLFFPPDEIQDSDLAVLMFTSGSTSKPKPVMLTHEDLSNYAMGQTDVFDGSPKGSTLMSAPNYHIAGLTGMILSIYGGRTLVLLPQFEASQWLETVQREKITHAFLVPTMMKRLLDHPDFDRYDLSSLETVSYGAAPMPAPVIEEAIRRFPETTGFVNAFGMTETTATVTMLTQEDHRLTGTEEEIAKKRKRLRSVGKPLPDVEIRILDDDGNPLPPGEVGRVVILTSRTMKGYYGDEAASQKALTDEGWIRTDDMGYLDEDGYLFLVGRKDDMIIRGGENISPAEVEDVIARHPGVSEVAVIPVPSLEWGQEVMAVVIPKDPDNPPTEEEIIEFCRERMTSFKKPSYVRFVSDFPRTATGKIQKVALREQYAKAMDA